MEGRDWTEANAHLLGLARPSLDPLLGLVPSLVESKKTSLATTLDQLIRLCDKLGVEDPSRELSVGGDGTSRGVP